MYYVAVIHEIVYAKDAGDAAEKFRNHEIQDNQAVQWNSKDKQCYLIALPNGIDNILHKLAILRKPVSDNEDSYTQVESIANDGIESSKELGRRLEESEASIKTICSNIKIFIR